MNTNATIKRVNEDYIDGCGPFDSDDYFHEFRVAADVASPDEAEFLFFGASLAYNRGAAQLWENNRELYERNPQYFTPSACRELGEEHLSDVFEDIGYRYHNRDAKYWHRNAEILSRNYCGTVTKLLRDVDYDAVKLVERFEEDGFYCLSGDKIGPFVARLLHERVHSLKRLHELEIPVDVHIRRLTNDLLGTEMNDEAIRQWWREYCAEHDDVDPVLVDRPLWLIGSYWNEWGEEYWQEVTGDV